MKRETGYYWVKPLDSREWVIALFSEASFFHYSTENGFVWLIGEREYKESEFMVTSDRLIKKPDENPDIKNIKNVISDIMINDGPDGHCDGSDIIADFIEATFNGDFKKWTDNYFITQKKDRTYFKE